MDILYLLIPLSVVLAVAIGAAFWRAVDTGQFDDLDGPAVRVLADDDSLLSSSDRRCARACSGSPRAARTR